MHYTNSSNQIFTDVSTTIKYFNTYRYMIFSKLNIISNGNFTVFMNLCDNIPEKYCGKDLKFCLKDEKGCVLTGEQFTNGKIKFCS